MIISVLNVLKFQISVTPNAANIVWQISWLSGADPGGGQGALALAPGGKGHTFWINILGFYTIKSWSTPGYRSSDFLSAMNFDLVTFCPVWILVQLQTDTDWKREFKAILHISKTDAMCAQIRPLIFFGLNFLGTTPRSLMVVPLLILSTYNFRKFIKVCFYWGRVIDGHFIIGISIEEKIILKFDFY